MVYYIPPRWFDSKAEPTRGETLVFLEKAGQIINLCYQIKVEGINCTGAHLDITFIVLARG